jgi:hypothetical protein
MTNGWAVSPDFINFLAARYDELEASAATLHDAEKDADGECVCGYPAAVMADLASKRAILRSAEPDMATLDWMNAEGWDDGYAAAIKNVIRRLGEAFADHPDQKREWYFPI